ncbi:MAG: HD domain-containing protein [Bacteroidetes bacterium]|nr:HD domain-containing protein [Bacteroidota bacterium]
MDYESLREQVLNWLEKELDKNLAYHSVGHTKDVIRAVERLAKMENVNGKAMTLLKTAALFHDVGFTKVYDGHEEASIEIATEMLPKYGYSENDLEQIKGMIRSTRIPQSPQNHLEEIMADADLDYIGRDDLFMIGQKLQYEWNYVGKISSLREWHEKQLSFLKNHSFFTPSAQKLRERKKQKNIKELENLLCPKN